MSRPNNSRLTRKATHAHGALVHEHYDGEVAHEHAPRHSLAQTTRICPTDGLTLFSMLVYSDGTLPGLWSCSLCGKSEEEGAVYPEWAKPSVYELERKKRVLKKVRKTA